MPRTVNRFATIKILKLPLARSQTMGRKLFARIYPKEYVSVHEFSTSISKGILALFIREKLQISC